MTLEALDVGAIDDEVDDLAAHDQRLGEAGEAEGVGIHIPYAA